MEVFSQKFFASFDENFSSIFRQFSEVKN